jgi:hypothetical protein
MSWVIVGLDGSNGLKWIEVGRYMHVQVYDLRSL